MIWIKKHFIELLIIIAIAFIFFVIIFTKVDNAAQRPFGRVRQVKVVGHVPTMEEGSWTLQKITYEHWVYEDVATKERFIRTSKYGEVGEIIKIRK